MLAGVKTGRIVTSKYLKYLFHFGRNDLFLNVSINLSHHNFKILKIRLKMPIYSKGDKCLEKAFSKLAEYSNTFNQGFIMIVDHPTCI